MRLCSLIKKLLNLTIFFNFIYFAVSSPPPGSDCALFLYNFFLKISFLSHYLYYCAISSPPPEWGCALAGGCMWTRLKPCHIHHITVKSRDITFLLRWTENLCMNCNFQKLNLMQSSRWWLQCADTLPPAWPSNTGKGKLFVKKRQRKPGQKRREKQGHLQTRRHSPFDLGSRSPRCEHPPSRSSTP